MVKIDSFYFHVNQFAEQLTDSTPLTATKQQNPYVDDEKAAIQQIEKQLLKEDSNRKANEIAQTSLTIDHKEDLTKISKAVKILKEQYDIAYSNDKAYWLIQKIYYFFKRWHVSMIADRVCQMIQYWIDKDKFKPFKLDIKPEAIDMNSLHIQNCVVLPPDVFKRKTHTVGLNPDDYNSLFKNKSFAETAIKIDTVTFFCEPVDGVQTGTIGLTSSDHDTFIQSTLFSYSKEGQMHITFTAFPVNGNRLNAAKAIIELSHNHKPKEVNHHKGYWILPDSKRLENVIKSTFNHGCLSRHENYSIIYDDKKMKFNIHDIINSNSSGSDEFGVLTKDTEIEFRMATHSKPIIFENQCQLAPNNIFTFSIECKNDSQSISDLNITHDDIVSQLLEKTIHKGDEGVLILRNQEFTLKINGEALLLRLENVQTIKDNRVYSDWDEWEGVRYFSLQKTSKIRFEDDFGEIKFKSHIEKHQKEQKINDPRKETLKDYFDSKGLVGMPDSLESTLSPLIASFGPLKKIQERRGVQAERGILFYGPPGTGKTTFARSIAEYLDCPPERVQMISGTDVLKSVLGDTEKTIRELFERAEKATAKGEIYVLVIDEIDSLLRKRTYAKNSWEVTMVDQFLAKMDGLHQYRNLLIIGMTNNFETIDDAALRHGRFGTHIEIKLPEKQQRKEIFNVYLKTLKEDQVLHGDIELNVLVERTEGLSGAHIKGIVESANRLAFDRLGKKYHAKRNSLIEDLETCQEGKITQADLLKSIEACKKNPDELKGSARDMYM